jgi:putative membrane protein insertion efficiency factor
MRSPLKTIDLLGKAPLLALLRVYRVAISPALGPACRFEPTCSVYAQQAIERLGAVKGSTLALRRLLRCHPFSRGGLDPVPLPARAASRANSS